MAPNAAAVLSAAKNVMSTRADPPPGFWESLGLAEFVWWIWDFLKSISWGALWLLGRFFIFAGFGAVLFIFLLTCFYVRNTCILRADSKVEELAGNGSTAIDPAQDPSDAELDLEQGCSNSVGSTSSTTYDDASPAEAPAAFVAPGGLTHPEPNLDQDQASYETLFDAQEGYDMADDESKADASNTTEEACSVAPAFTAESWSSYENTDAAGYGYYGEPIDLDGGDGDDSDDRLLGHNQEGAA
ncbi:hypothetical protein B0T19DRAFT_213775 [Cercophora scortea]|uniref:Uncharacterized protein n=1 Tax=Cercophora scortea TaxID=314031 RepID=A0AAE0IFJ4_9PEZI|nr:hypothetical protein B0T19DRAFT_213775 [Cercophora scortea]